MSDYFVHPTAIIDPGVSIGTGTKIWHFSHVFSGVSIGERCILGQNCGVETDVVIGNGCKLQNNVTLYRGVSLEDDVFCGPSCVFTNVINPRAFIRRMSELRPTVVKRGATIGANATVICGGTLGEYCMIGSGAVTRGDIPPYALMVGVPARRIGWVCRCGVTLPKKEPLTCPACHASYQLVGPEQLQPIATA